MYFHRIGDILHYLSQYKNFGVKTFQAEDEIAGITSVIGASFAGNLAVTATSGPGIALKGEAMGLAVSTEMPIVKTLPAIPGNVKTAPKPASTPKIRTRFNINAISAKIPDDP